MTVLATIIVLGVLIFVHELGHFWAAKLVGVKVERFSIGLGPRVWGTTWGETEYVFSAVPLGGYVKMGGMQDEVLEKLEGGESSEPRVPGPRDFDGKPIWARTLVVSAGVIMNMVFAFLVYTFVAGFWGVPEPSSTRVGDVEASYLPVGAEALDKVPAGAAIVQVGSTRVETWEEVVRDLSQATPGPLTVRYSNPSGEVQIRVPDDEQKRLQLASAVLPWYPAVVGGVTPGSPAEKGGIQKGDRILAVDGTPIANWYDFLDAIQSKPGEKVELEIERSGRELTRAVTLATQETVDPVTGKQVTEGQIGIARVPGHYISVSLAEAVGIGYRQTVGVTGVILGFLRDLVTGRVSPRSVGSIVTIGQASGEAAQLGLQYFLSFLGLFSINLAVLNLLPIPVLDGGHLLFLAIEAVRGGHPLSVKQRLRWSQVGFVLLLGIMVWALSNDFMRLFGL